MTLDRRCLLMAGLGLLPLAGCNTVRVHRDVYDGLLPPGVTPRDANVALPLQGLKSRTVAIVLSANFEDYVATWVEHYERGGAQNRKEMMAQIGNALAVVNPLAAVGTGLSGSGGMIDRAIDASRQASDPRRVIDRLHAALSRIFDGVQVATDLADARARKADFIALADLHFTANAWGNAFHFRGGVHLLDASVRRLFVVAIDKEVPRTMADVSGAAALREGLGWVSTEIERGLAQRLRG